jgi:hypothetical protein
MKLFVRNPAGVKEYLSNVANTRQELANQIGSPWFTFNGNQYHVHQVIAESDSSSTSAGAVVGGLIGLIGGPVGLLIGGVIGGALGGETDKQDISRVNYFNQSTVLR